MTDQSNLARLIRNPATGEMEWLRPSTDELNLEALPDRLDDTMLARVDSIARSPLPALPPCDSYRLGQALRMMQSTLPRRHADDVSGELFVAAYERHIGHYSQDAIDHLCDQSIRTCKWFPTVAECLEILSGWRRADAAVMRQRQAERAAARERNLRYDESQKPIEPLPALTQADVDAMDETMVRLGLGVGSLIRDEQGQVRPAPEPSW
jgi:hypothetical protein